MRIKTNSRKGKLGHNDLVGSLLRIPNLSFRFVFSHRIYVFIHLNVQFMKWKWQFE